MEQDLAAWLAGIGLERYHAAFAENDIDLDTIAYLTEDDLKELGLSLGHRRKLQAALNTPAPDPAAAAEPVPAAAPETAEAVADLPPPSPEGATAPRAAERRQVTLVFCDLVGSTALAQRVDPETLQSIMHRYQDAVAGAITRYGGYVARYQGDGVVALFGWPNAYEDQAERALRASMAALSVLIEAKADPGEVAARDPAGAAAAREELRARCGIATGRVVVGDLLGASPQDRDAIYGDTPNLAARLQALAEPDEIILDDNTRALAGAYFDLEDTGTHALKGFDAPVQAWRLVGERAGASRFDAYRGASLTEFVGREREIAVVRDGWARTQEGEGQVVALSGEPGLGKSRILREFIRSCENVAEVVRLQCSPHYTNSAFYPLIAAVPGLAGYDPADDAERIAGALEPYLKSHAADWEEAGALLSELLGLPATAYPEVSMTPQRRKLRTVATLADLFGRDDPAGGRPRVLIVEDIHWVDASTLETLEVLIEGVQDRPCLVIITHRPEFERRWDAWPHVTHLTLNRLTRSQGMKLILRVAGGRALPEEITGQILSQTDGVPLFIEEMTRAILESDFLTEQDGALALNGPLPALAIPSTLQDSLMARLDRLAPVKEVIQAAACIGREFETRLLQQITARSDADLADALDQLVEAQLVFRRTGVEPERFIFKHALIQDAAYASLLNANRIKLHDRLARALTEAADQGADIDPLERARHLAAAMQPEQAAALYVEAGERLLSASSLAEAMGALELALGQCAVIETPEQRDPLALRTRLALGAARMASYGWAHPSVSDALEPAYDLARTLGSGEALGPIFWGLWVHYQTRTNFPEAHVWLSRLEDAAATDETGNLPVVRDMSAGCQYFWQAEYDRALGYTERLERSYVPERHGGIAMFTNHDPLCFALHWAGALLDWIAGRPDSSLDRLETAIDRARQVGHPFNRVFALTAGASNLIYLGETDRLLSFCEEAETVSREEGLGVFAEEVLVGQWRGGALVTGGDFAKGYPVIKSGNEFWTRMEGKICTAMFKSWVALGLSGTGRPGDALSMIDLTLDHCRQTGDRYMEPECWRLRAHMLTALSSDDAAVDHALDKAVETARQQKALSWELRAATDIARRAMDRGRAADARAALEPVLDRFAQGHATADYRAALRLLES